MKKVITILFITVTMLIIMAGLQKVYAANEYDLKITPSTENISPGQEIKVKFAFTEIKIKAGIGAAMGKIEYDKDVFEKITEANIKSGDGWATVTYNSQNSSEGLFAVERSSGDGIKEDNLLFEITFKVRDNIVADNTTIGISEISVSDGYDDYEIEDKNIVLKMKTEGTDLTEEKKETSFNEQINSTPEKIELSLAEEKIQTSKKENNLTQNNVTVLPYAGNSNIIITILLIVIVTGVISFIQYKRMKNI